MHIYIVKQLMMILFNFFSLTLIHFFFWKKLEFDKTIIRALNRSLLAFGRQTITGWRRSSEPTLLSLQIARFMIQRWSERFGKNICSQEEYNACFAFIKLDYWQTFHHTLVVAFLWTRTRGSWLFLKLSSRLYSVYDEVKESHCHH